MSFDTDDIICRKCMNDFNSKEHEEACLSHPSSEAIEDYYRSQSKRRAERVGVEPDVWWEAEKRCMGRPWLQALIQKLELTEQELHPTLLLEAFVMLDKQLESMEKLALTCITNHGCGERYGYMGHDGG